LKGSGFLFFSLIFFAACQLISPEEKSQEETKTPLARVGEKYLYIEDLSSLTRAAVSPQDSADLTSRYIQSWIKNELMLKRAEEVVAFDLHEINRKVSDYRYALMVFEFKKAYLSKNMDTSISEDQIKEYYDSHLDNFLLKQNIIKGRYYQASVEAPKIKKARDWIKSEKESDLEDLNSFCIQFATSYNLDDSIWINFDEIILNTPFQSIPNKIQFLQMNRFAETSDSLYHYYLFIKDYKIQDQLSPLEFVGDQIKKILLNKRKVELSEQLEDQVLQEAKVANSFEIY
jgi:hypothetical protein